MSSTNIIKYETHHVREAYIREKAARMPQGTRIDNPSNPDHLSAIARYCTDNQVDPHDYIGIVFDNLPDSFVFDHVYLNFFPGDKAKAIFEKVTNDTPLNRTIRRKDESGETVPVMVSEEAYFLHTAMNNIYQLLQNQTGSGLLGEESEEILCAPWYHFDPLAIMLYAGRLPGIQQKYGEAAAKQLRRSIRKRHAVVELGFEKAATWIGEQYAT